MAKMVKMVTAKVRKIIKIRFLSSAINALKFAGTRETIPAKMINDNP